ncbi:hypothetical protein MHTCC0001_10110 [Flavobacteriaceae bacterium MHTCC 0001]
MVAILCYTLAISKTIALKQEVKQLEKQEISFKNTPKQLMLLKQKQKYYDSILAKHQIKGSSIQNNLLNLINSYADSSNIKVITFLEPHTVTQNNLKVNTYTFTLEGNYNDILLLIYKLESNTKFGEIINFHFEKKKNFRTNTFYLQASILLMNFG